MDVAEGLDFQLAFALAAQGRLDGEAVDAAELALRVESLEFAGLGEVLPFFGQVDEFFDRLAEAAQQSAQMETDVAAAFALAAVLAAVAAFAAPPRFGSVLLHFGHDSSLSVVIFLALETVEIARTVPRGFAARWPPARASRAYSGAAATCCCGACHHQVSPISRALSTEATSRRI